MAQFDVHRNQGRDRDIAPYMLVVQSARFDKSVSRVVVPLFKAGALRTADEYFNARFVIEGQTVVMDPLQMTAVSAARLSPVVVNIAGQGDAVIRALDLLLYRANG